MISSIDGRLLVQRWTPPASGINPDLVTDTYESTAARLDAQGLIVGRKTMSEFKGVRVGESSRGEVNFSPPFVGDTRGRQLAIVVDLHGKLRYECDGAEGFHIVAVLSRGMSDAYLSSLRALNVSYVFSSEGEQGLVAALQGIGSLFSVHTLLLEGGGRINGAFLKADLIDEISLLIYPGIDGLNGVPSIFDYAGKAEERPAAGRALRHTHTTTLDGGVVWARYLVERAGLPQVFD